MPAVKKITVHKNDIHQRVDRYIRNFFPGMSLSRIHFLFRKKEIKIGNKPVKKNYQLRQGDILQCYGLTDRELAGTSREQVNYSRSGAFKLPVLHEDKDLLVIDKPEGIAVHPGTGLSGTPTVIEQVGNYLGVDSESLFKPSLIHRIDKDTSGILMVAKTGEALRWWTRQFREKRLEKYYYALVPGRMKQSKGELNFNLQKIHSKTGGAKTLVNSSEGKSSLTRYELHKMIGDYSLLKLRLITGRMHQIRAHLQAEGHPIAGDKRYGNFELNKTLRKNFGLTRLFLHAFEIKGLGMHGETVHYKSNIPKDLSRFIKALQQ